MFASMLQVERAKLFGRKLLWVESIIIVALSVLVLVALVAAFYAPELAEDAADASRTLLLWPEGLKVAGSLAASNQLGTMMMLVLASALITQEYGWGTLALLLSRGISRPVAFLSKLAVILMAAAMLAVVAIVMGIGTSIAFTLITSQPLIFQRADLTLALGLLVGTMLSLLPYIGLTVLLSILSRSSVTSIGAGLGFLVAETLLRQVFTAIGGTFAKIALYFPASLGQQFFFGVQQPGAEAAGLLSAPICALLLVLYGTIFSGIALWQFMKQDLTA